jgi:transcriptional regulator NrdR family protein
MIRTFAKLLSKFFKDSPFKDLALLIMCISSFLIVNAMWLRLDRKYVAVILLGMIIVFILIQILKYFSSKIKSQQMTTAIESHHSNDNCERKQIKFAVKDIQNKWKQAIHTLKDANINIYELPWTLLIGEPQSGKTTSIRHSELDFPLGTEGLSGSGGTVNCDWLFTNEAVFIDTAGRFTMPVDAAPDKKEWRTFLKLLSRYRSRCPINTVVVTIPATSLLEDSPETIKKKATHIRNKLIELTDVLGVEFPVYIMISKMDLVVGFSDLCMELSDTERSQICGWNQQSIKPVSFDADEFKANFNHLFERLYLWILRRLKTLPENAITDQLLGFSGEFKHLQKTLHCYLETIFRKDRYNMPLLWRGCYFSSSIQEGRAIYSAIVKGTENTSVIKKKLSSFFSNKSCFVKNFYHKIITERGIVRITGKSKRRENRLKLTAVFSSITLMLITGLFLWSAFKTLPVSLHSLEKKINHAAPIIIDQSIEMKNTDNDIFHLIKSIAKHRHNIDKYGVGFWVPLKISELLNNLEWIEGALAKIVLHRAVQNFDKNIHHRKLDNHDEIDAFVKQLRSYSLILSDSYHSIDAQSIESLFQMMDIRHANIHSTEEVVGLWNLFTGNLSHCPLIENKSEGMLIFREGINTLSNFWKKTPQTQWKELLNSVYFMADAYTKVISKDLTINQFVDHIKHFNQIYLHLQNNTSQTSLPFLNNASDICSTDFDQLQTELFNQNENDLTYAMQLLVSNYRSVCSDLSHNLESKVDETLKDYTFIVQKDGSLHPHLSLTQALFGDVLDFIDNFSQIERNIRNQNNQLSKEDIQSNMTKCMEQKEVLVNKVNALAKKMPGEWQPDKFKKVISDHINNVFLDAHKRLLKPPHAYINADFLSQYFETAQQIKDWVEGKKDYDSEFKTQLNSIIMQQMLDSYGYAINYWRSVLKKNYPAKQVLKQRQWHQAFRRLKNNSHFFVKLTHNSTWKKFIDNMPSEIRKQINQKYFSYSIWKKFIESMQLEIRRQIKKKYFSVTDMETILDADYLFLTKHFDKFLSAQKQLYNALISLTDCQPFNWNVINPESHDDLHSFKALSEEIETETGSDRTMLKHFKMLEKHCLALFIQRSKKQIQTEWEHFLEKWFSHFGYRFPFGKTKGMVKYNPDQNTIVMSLSQTTTQELKDFFQSQIDSPEVIKCKISDISRLTGEKETYLYADRDQESFLNACSNWYTFLFEQKPLSKMHRNLTIEVDTKGTSGANRFTKLTFEGIEKNKQFTLRVSGNSSTQIKLDFQNVADILINGINEEEIEKASAIQIKGGNLALLEYMYSYGRRIQNDHYINKWETFLVFPDPGYKKSVNIRIVITWKNVSLPDLIQWPARALWGKVSR